MGFNNELVEFSNEEILTDYPTDKLVTFRSGGNAKYYVCPHSLKNLRTVISICEEYSVPYVIIGNGSNVLISDKGYNGVLISLKNFNSVYVNKRGITAFAGATLKKTFDISVVNSLSGLEELVGIPATIGGATCMNAGAFNKNISDLIESVTSLRDGRIIKRYKEDCKFSYRNSLYKNSNEVIISIDIILKNKERYKIEELSKFYQNKRKESQPIGNCCGSVFNNPKNGYAGKILEDTGLKGYRIGGAHFSNKHANFIVNDRNATAKDIYSLILLAKNVVKEKYKIDLQEELILIGEF